MYARKRLHEIEIGERIMLKKIIIGILLITVIGAGGTALVYNMADQETEVEAATPELLVNRQRLGTEQAEQQPAQTGQGELNLAVEGKAGVPWQETGTITEIDDYGFHFALQDDTKVYIELGYPDYWQNQGVDLQVDQAVTVNGSIDEGMIHASQVMLADGQTLQVRDETGQPLWNRGATNRQGQNASQVDGDHISEPQAQVDEWITIEGTVKSFLGSQMTIATPEDEIITFQTGQPRFFADQGVTLNVGDEIIVVGFYEGDQFIAGDITQVATGLRVMLRDPNGRPLWSGPGGNANAGNANGGSGNGGNGNGGNKGGNGFADGNL